MANKRVKEKEGAMKKKWVVLDSQGSVVGRHKNKKLAVNNCRYAGDHVMPYNRKYKWGADYKLGEAK
jgi:hypothetical protein